jgi:ribosomal protein S1
VVATVQLVKEYGLILKVSEDYTGFIINEQKKSGKTFKEGASIEGTLLDIDYDRKMLDLSERVIKDVKAGKDKSKAVVELTKDSYMIVSLKQNRQKFGVCLL